MPQDVPLMAIAWDLLLRHCPPVIVLLSQSIYRLSCCKRRTTEYVRSESATDGRFTEIQSG